MTEVELREALVDYRRAARVVVAVQQRLNEVFYRFHLAMSDAQLGFVSWGPNRYRSPGRSGRLQFHPSKWSWDLFPGFCMAAEWQSDQPLPVRRAWLGFEADSAIGDALKVGGEPDPRSFLPVTHEGSRTELWIALQTCDQPNPNWGQAWQGDIKARWTESINNDIRWQAGGQTGLYRSSGIPLERLVSPEAIQDVLIAPVLIWLKEQYRG